MATVYRNPSLAGGAPVGPAPDGQGYTTYKEADLIGMGVSPEIENLGVRRTAAVQRRNIK